MQGDPPPKSHIEGQGGAVWTFLSEEHLLFPSRPDAPSWAMSDEGVIEADASLYPSQGILQCHDAIASTRGLLGEFFFECRKDASSTQRGGLKKVPAPMPAGEALPPASTGKSTSARQCATSPFHPAA